MNSILFFFSDFEIYHRLFWPKVTLLSFRKTRTNSSTLCLARGLYVWCPLLTFFPYLSCCPSYSLITTITFCSSKRLTYSFLQMRTHGICLSLSILFQVITTTFNSTHVPAYDRILFFSPTRLSLYSLSPCILWFCFFSESKLGPVWFHIFWVEIWPTEACCF